MSQISCADRFQTFTKCRTFRKYLLNFCPGILTLTVLSILPALTTTPTGDLMPADASSDSTDVPCSATAADIWTISLEANIVSPEVDVLPIIEGMGEPDETSVAKHRALRQAWIAGLGHSIVLSGPRRLPRLILKNRLLFCDCRRSVAQVVLFDLTTLRFLDRRRTDRHSSSHCRQEFTRQTTCFDIWSSWLVPVFSFRGYL